MLTICAYLTVTIRSVQTVTNRHMFSSALSTLLYPSPQPPRQHIPITHRPYYYDGCP